MRRPKLVLLETDALTAERFRRGAGRIYDVRVEQSSKDALNVVAADPLVTAFVAGTNREGESPVEVLERVKSIREEVLRVMLAAPTDLSAVIQGMHSGAVERSLNLPAGDKDILAAVTRPAAAASPVSPPAPAAPPARPAGRRAS